MNPRGEPTVSVVIPAHNAAATISATIRSALAQTASPLEIIVVDDGSTDATGDLVRGIEDERLKLVRQENTGVAEARNAGIKEARGELIALLDADDLWVPDKLERQLEVFRQRADAVAVQTGAFFVDDNLDLMFAEPCVPATDALLDTLLFKNLPNNMSTLLIKRDTICALGGFDSSLEILEEWDIHIRLTREGEVVNLREPKSLYRVHAGNRSRNLEIHIAPGFAILGRVFADPSLPAYVRKNERLVYARFYVMLAGAALRVRNWKEVAHWIWRAFLRHPIGLRYVITLPIRRFQRRRSRRQWSGRFAALRMQLE